jgi:hypothetical protein
MSMPSLEELLEHIAGDMEEIISDLDEIKPILHQMRCTLDQICDSARCCDWLDGTDNKAAA